MSYRTARRSAELDVTSIRSALRQREAILDDDFDALYPAAQRYRSEMHWTPVDVALLAGTWLAEAGSVLDVGSGVGKACHIGALATDIVWSGVERDRAMVDVASRVAHDLRVESRTRFIHGEALALDWSRFGGIYLFNPFGEALCAPTPDPMIRQTAYLNDVGAVERKLLTLYPGARVVTYHGFGGEFPAPFELVDRVQAHGGFACLWLRRRDGALPGVRSRSW